VADGSCENYFVEDLRGRIFTFESDSALTFSRSPLTAVWPDGRSITLMHRSRPLPKCEGRSSRRAMLQTSEIVALMSLTLGTAGEGPSCEISFYGVCA
jgi:hypothetical protein